jgi:hypothetical protein
MPRNEPTVNTSRSTLANYYVRCTQIIIDNCFETILL